MGRLKDRRRPLDLNSKRAPRDVRMNDRTVGERPTRSVFWEFRASGLVWRTSLSTRRCTRVDRPPKKMEFEVERCEWRTEMQPFGNWRVASSKAVRATRRRARKTQIRDHRLASKLKRRHADTLTSILTSLSRHHHTQIIPISYPCPYLTHTSRVMPLPSFRFYCTAPDISLLACLLACHKAAGIGCRYRG